MKATKQIIKQLVFALTLACMVLFLSQDVHADNLPITQIAETSNSITVSWPAKPSGRYIIYYKVQNTNAYAFFDLNNAGSYTIGGLPAGAKVQVSVSSTVGESGYLTCATKPVLNVGDLHLTEWKPGLSLAKIQWENTSNATPVSGYDVEIYDKNGKLIKSENGLNTNTTNVISGKIKNSGFAYRVRGYFTEIGGRTVYGDWSDYKRVVVQPKVSSDIKTVGNTKTATMKWKKMKGVKSYTIYRKVGENGKYKKVKTVKTTNFSQAGLKKSKVYYYYVVANGLKVVGKAANSTTDNYIKEYSFY